MIAELAATATELLRFAADQTVLSVIVFAVVLALCTVLGSRLPGVRHALWSLVFVTLVLPPALRLPWTLIPLAPALGAGSPELVAEALGAAGQLGLSQGAHMPGQLAATATVAQAWPLLLVALWLAGAVACLTGMALRARGYRQLVRRACPVEDPRLLSVLHAWRSTFRIRRSVRLLTSPARVAPFTTGLLRPVVFLPRAVLDLEDRTSAEVAIAHELAHVARLDSLWLAVQHAIQAVYFFNPLTWLSGSRLVQQRESICDAMVLSCGTLSAAAYARGLLDIVTARLDSVAAPAASNRKGYTVMRIHAVLATRAATRPRAALAVACTWALASVLLPGIASSDAAAVAAPSAVPQLETPQPQAEPAALINPVPGSTVTWAFTEGRDPFTGQVRHHRGIDLAAPAGTPILAPADGVVELASKRYEKEPASGTVLVLDHGEGLKTFYAHLGSLTVTAGDRVAANDVIANVGSTGKSTGPHLHFEVWQDGEPVDPGSYVTPTK